MKKALQDVAIFGIFLVSLALAACTPAPSQQAKGTDSQGIYATTLHNSGEDESTAAYLAIAQRSQQLLAQLEAHTATFVMDAYNYQSIDDQGTPLYTMNAHDLPVEIAPNGHCIRVSPNYFAQNPIETADGAPLLDQLVQDPRTLNLLVPEQYRSQEADLLAAHLADFYFQTVTATNDYNEMSGQPERLSLTPADLSIHLIYVKDGQRYFTYRADCAPQTGNWITDPVVQIYTGNIHCNYAHSILSQWCYYPSDATSPEAAYQELLPYITACGAQASLQQLDPIAP